MRATRILLVALSLAGAEIVPAQTPGEPIIPTRGFHPAHTYSISDIESIDQASGSLSLHIPIAQLPPGPAGFTAGLSLVYNSRYWNTQPSPVPGQQTTYYYLAGTHYGAWRLEFEPGLDMPFSGDGTCPGGDDHFRFIFIESDGSSHLLYNNLVPGSTAGYCRSSFQDLTTPNAWYTKDGSFLQLEFDPPAPGGDPFGSWTLRRSDGTSVRDDAAADKTYLRDRNYDAVTNNHQIAISLGCLDAEHCYKEMEDSLGRKIRIDETYHQPNPSQPSELVQSIVTQVGHDGNPQAPLTWTITWAAFPDITTPTTYDCLGGPLGPGGSWGPCAISGIVGKPGLAASLQLPNGLQYQFQYNARYRELSRMTVPTGAMVDYGYWGDSLSYPLRFYRIHGNPLNSKTVTHDGVAEAWAYANSDDLDPNTETRTWRTTTAPDGGTTRHDFFGISHYTPGNVMGGLVTDITHQDGSTLDREWIFPPNPWVQAETEMRANASGSPVLTYKRIFTTDTNGNITSREERDSTTLLRKTVTTYVNPGQDSTYTGTDCNSYSHWIYPGCHASGDPQPARNLVASRETQNASGTVLTRSEFSYQETTPSRMVGNLVRQYDWDNTRPNADPNQNQITPGTPLNDSIAVKSEYTYTARGNLLTERDPNGNQVTYSYAAIPNCPNVAGDSTDLYRTLMQRGGITSVLQQWTYQHKCISGLPEQATDPNGLATATTYDRYGRPTQVTDGALRTTRHTYPQDGDANLWVVTTADVLANGDQRQVSVSRFDQLGRPRLTQQLEQMTTPAAAGADESLGIKTETKYRFTAGVNAVLVSNPYRASDPTASTRGWSATRRDTAGRNCSVETFDGAAEPTLAQNCAPTSGASGRTQFSYDATATFTEQTITETTPDPSGAVRKLRSDVLGRLVTVIEDPSAENYTTSYGYDLRDNLASVTQGATSRSFSYSSLNRLLTATNPENGAISHSYDLAGNLMSRAMAGSTRASTFDDQHRVLTHSYNDGTPAVTFTYDTAQTAEKPAGCPADNGPIGRLAKVSSSTFSSYYFYNQLGHAACNRQRVQTYAPFDFLYTNTPQGEWAAAQYPSGRTLTMAFDDAGRATSLTGNVVPYASAVQYAAHGAVGRATLGNGTVETAIYNGRLQLQDLKLGSAPGQPGQGTADRWRLQNCYSDSDPCVGSGSANNGNVRYQTLTVLNGAAVKTVYRYDGLNRLKRANETPTSPASPVCPDAASHWCQQYGYDARGNRRVEFESNLGFVPGRPERSGRTTASPTRGLGMTRAAT